MPAHHTITVRPGLELAVREAGHGSPVLVLHGGPGPASVAPLVNHLTARHTVLAPTHPGWEDTARPADLDPVPALAAAYLDLLDHLALHDATVVGTSFGGWVAAQTVLDDREGRISRLVLMDAIGPVVPGQRITMPTASRHEPGASTPRGGPSAGTMAALRAYAGPSTAEAGLLPRLSSVTCPVLVLWGENDPVATPDFGRAYAAAFPHARFELIPDAGHLPLREHSEAVYTTLDAFLTP